MILQLSCTCLYLIDLINQQLSKRYFSVPHNLTNKPASSASVSHSSAQRSLFLLWQQHYQHPSPVILIATQSCYKVNGSFSYCMSTCVALALVILYFRYLQLPSKENIVVHISMLHLSTDLPNQQAQLDPHHCEDKRYR